MTACGLLGIYRTVEKLCGAGTNCSNALIFVSKMPFKKALCFQKEKSIKLTW